MLAKQIRQMERSEKRFSQDDEYKFSNSHVSLERIKLDDMEELLKRHYLKNKNTLKMSTSAHFQEAILSTVHTLLENEKSAENIVKMLKLKVEDEETLKEKIIDAISLSDNKSISLFQNFITIIDDFSNQQKLAKLKEIEQNKPIDQLIHYMNEFFIDGKELHISENDIHIKTYSGQHPISELSSGERNFLTFLSVILLKASNKDFVIIDEPEISLSLNWKRDIVRTLEKIVPSAQFIIATHSTSITPDEENLCELKRDPENMRLEKKEKKIDIQKEIELLMSPFLSEDC
jgi:predicted ATP-binding protein involved in virulence